MSGAGPLKSWLFERALPLWSTRGFDDRRGSFVEALAEDATPLAALDRRVLVQARQVYVFSHAALLGWPGPALDRARFAFERMTQVYWRPEGGWRFSAAPDGTVRDDRLRTYDQAFVLLACAWYFRASADTRAQEWAERTLDALDRLLAHPQGGYRDGLPDFSPRRQNPHMHLLEAMLALHAAFGPGAHLERAQALMALFRDRFFDAKAGLLYEEFAPDWRRLAPDRARLEPGHHCEWIWLLGEYARATGEDQSLAQRALAATVVRIGVDAGDGLLWDGVTSTGERWAATKRLWPQCEALRAAAALGDRARIAQLSDALLRRHLDAAPGLWRERVAADGTPIAGPVPATSLYHLMGAVACCEADRV